MIKPPKPHYVYVSHQPDGEYKLVIMSMKQEVQELPLTADSAFRFMIDFAKASNALYKKEITQLGNKEKQEDMFTDVETKKSENGKDSDRASI